MVRKKPDKTISIVLFATVFVILVASHIDNAAFSQAVPLVDVETGNTTLDNALPDFYDCIDESIKTNDRSGLDSYFEKEPTKNEVTTCYYKIFNNTSQGNNDEIRGNDEE
jgi:hypothetical protein